MENVILKVVRILVVLSGLAWGLQKLFPPTQKDIEQAEQRAKELQARMDAKVGAAPAAQRQKEKALDKPRPEDYNGIAHISSDREGLMTDRNKKTVH